MSGVPARGEVLALYRRFLRAARRFPQYNVREYVRRRAGEGFRERAGDGPPAAAAAFAAARRELEVAERQAVLYRLYAGPMKSVMELDAAER
eukprot:SM000040S14825  [mRNA]  locus=s40:556245:557278:- [translate_table: standard]